MDFDANYIKQCVAPGIEPAAIEELINETSGYNELAVKITTKDGRKAVVVRQPTTRAAMVETVAPFIRTGADVRFGLMLIPARLLPDLKVSVAQAAEPCTNIRIASLVYQRAREMVAASIRDPRDVRAETVRAYVTGSYNGTPIEGLIPSGPVVVAKPPLREFERREAAGEREPRRVAEAIATPASDSGMEGPPKPARAAAVSGGPPTMFEVTSAPMTIDLSRFREAR